MDLTHRHGTSITKLEVLKINNKRQSHLIWEALLYMYMVLIVNGINSGNTKMNNL